MLFALCEIGTFRVFDLAFRTKAELVPRALSIDTNLNTKCGAVESVACRGLEAVALQGLRFHPQPGRLCRA